MRGPHIALVSILNVAVVAGALFTASRGSAATLDVALAAPTASMMAGASVEVSATVTGTNYEITSVTASVSGTQTALSYTTSWQGAVPLAGLPYGPLTITVTATDAIGEMGSASVSIVHDDPPVVTVTSPVEWSVVRPWAHIVVTCVDNDPTPCASVQASFTGVGNCTPPAIPSGTMGIDVMLNTQACDGSVLAVTASATDTANQKVNTNGYEFGIEASPVLREVAFVPGNILDFDATAILYARSDAVVLRQRADQSETILYSSPYVAASSLFAPMGMFGSVAPFGILTSSPDGLRLWRNGSLAISDVNSSGLIGGLAGYDQHQDWLATGWGDDVYTQSFTDAGSTTPTNTGVQFTNGFGVDTSGNVYVSLSGDLAFIPQGDYLTEGSTTYLAAGSAGQIWAVSAISDGTNVAYGSEINGYHSVAYIPGTGNVTLSTVPGLPNAGTDYYVRDGWIAYTAPGAGNGPLQVFRRSPSGTITQASVWATASSVDGAVTSQGAAERDGVDSAGEVMLINSGDGRRHLAVPGTALPYDVSTSLGRPLERQGVWYVTYAGSLAVLDLDGGIDAGYWPPLPDAGAAGTSLDGGAVSDATQGADASSGSVSADATTSPADAAIDQTTGDGDGGTTQDVSAPQSDVAPGGDGSMVTTGPDASVVLNEAGGNADAAESTGGSGGNVQGGGGCSAASATRADGSGSWPAAALALGIGIAIRGRRRGKRGTSASDRDQSGEAVASHSG